MAELTDEQVLDCEWCGLSAVPEEVTGGFACSGCHRLPPECTCYEHYAGHMPGCPMRQWIREQRKEGAGG